MSNVVRWRRLALAAIDALLIAAALWGGYLLRFAEIYAFNVNQYMLVVPFFIVVRLLMFWAFRLYRGVLRYAGMGEMVAITAAVALGTAILLALNVGYQHLPLADWFPGYTKYFLLDYAQTPPRPYRVPIQVVLLESLLTLFGMALIRFSRRIVIYQALIVAEEAGAQRRRRLAIIGAADLGEAALRQINASPTRPWRPVAIVDDDPEKLGLHIHGVKVEGTISDLSHVIQRHEVEDVLVAVRDISPEKLREIVSACADANVRFQILPSVQDVMSGRVSLNQIRPVEIEDLLGREPVKLTLADDANYVRGKTVMITGAGGSIGSELCRQLVGLGPAAIVMYGHGENSIYEITQELSRAGHKNLIHSVIGDIRDQKKLRATAEKFRPQIFFHAAAHKHVPLMEAHPEEAVKNNVVGTLYVADIADEIQAERFILISSDKAVRSTNVMGATKRLAEMIVFCKAQTSKTLFTAVRFGNVLGSRGSVVPLFRRQIAAGGPVTITSPDVTRYFMTIPEAVSLVIQAGSMNQQRRLFLLDMGKPVRIVDLARNLIRLSGLEPDRDIEIKFTGLRPGEKICEELLTSGEDIKSTGMGKIFMTEPDDCEEAGLRLQLQELEALADANDGDAVKEKLRELVPDYGPETSAEEAGALATQQS